MLSLAAIAWLAFTSQPYPVPAFTSDKLNHFIAFTELAVIIRLGWPALHLAIPFLTLLSFGLAIELGQAMVSYRHFSMADLGADVAGIVVGFCLFPIIRYIQENPATSKH